MQLEARLAARHDAAVGESEQTRAALQARVAEAERASAEAEAALLALRARADADALAARHAADA